MNIKISLFNLFSFIFILVTATIYHWSPKDIIWSLWISSLTLGYSFLIVTVLSIPFREDAWRFYQRKGKLSPLPEGKERYIQPVFMNIFIFIATFFLLRNFSFIQLIVLILLLISTFVSVGMIILWESGASEKRDSIFIKIPVFLPFMIFMMGFFTFHFLGFHFIHGLFLNHFFPLVESTPNDFQNIFMLFRKIVFSALKQYWLFITFSAVSRIPEYRKAIFESPSGPEIMFRPYINVIRMHLMIFIFAFVKFLNLESVVIYFILIFYFFPMKDVIGIFRRNRT